MTMATNAPPSRDPADEGTLLGAMNVVLRKFLQGVDDMLPARVISYDRGTNRVQVVPLVRVLTTDGRQVMRPQLASLPVVQLGGGGHVLSFNLEAGNLGWIKANDRDISLFLQNFQVSAPNTLRFHSFQDAVFIPDVMTGYTIDAEDSSAAVLQTLDGSVKVSVQLDRVVMQAGASRIEVSPGAILIDGPTVIINGIPFESHRHTGVLTGGGTSGGPTV